MKVIGCARFLLLLCFCSGCASRVSSNHDDYVGEYVFTPIGSSPEKSASFVILKKDGTAIEIRFFKETGRVDTTTTKWELLQDNGESIGIGAFEHPVQGAPGHIKLGINDDLDQYYEKVR